jgi:hypothetical protein
MQYEASDVQVECGNFRGSSEVIVRVRMKVSPTDAMQFYLSLDVAKNLNEAIGLVLDFGVQKDEPTHKQMLARQHDTLDQIVASWLVANPGKLASKCNVLQLLDWSYSRTVRT